jgi:hypothetical protein
LQRFRLLRFRNGFGQLPSPRFLMVSFLARLLAGFPCSNCSFDDTRLQWAILTSALLGGLSFPRRFAILFLTFIFRFAIPFAILLGCLFSIAFRPPASFNKR